METEKNLHASLPSVLLAEAEKIAAAEHVSMDDFLQNAVRRYVDERGGTGIDAGAGEQAGKFGVNEEGINGTGEKPWTVTKYDPNSLTAEEWISELRAWTHRHDGMNLPILSDEAMSRESIYEDRGL